jgi:hypothetical protein
MSYPTSQPVRLNQLLDELRQLADKFEKHGHHEEAVKTRMLLAHMARLEQQETVEAMEE